MTAVTDPTRTVPIQHDAEIHTWFGIGGGADRLARPRSIEELRACLREDPSLRVLGDGANLLVDDDGVGELVVSLNDPAFTSWTIDQASSIVRVMAGANLPKLINECVRLGRAGIEGLGGIPATLGGALVMNAGGAFGQIADVVVRVHALDRAGKDVTLDRRQIDFSYRHSGLNDLILLSAELDLPPADHKPLRLKLKEVMAYKSKSQPMAERSAGCVFKNPILPRDIDGIGARGTRVSAGMLIDRAGCKGLSVGEGKGASVSQRHANFIVTDPQHATARDVINLMALVRARVADALGVTIEPEVVVWTRNAAPPHKSH